MIPPRSAGRQGPALSERTARALRIGVISDTHGLLRGEVRSFLIGCDYIIHGGDIGNGRILEELGVLAPVIAVRGNNDTEPWAMSLRETELARLGDIFVWVIHDLGKLDLNAVPASVRVVVCGHSHKARIEERGGILYVNPGSCGPRRFRLPISVAEMNVSKGGVAARIVPIDDARSSPQVPGPPGPPASRAQAGVTKR